jgi:hypothetical protein
LYKETDRRVKAPWQWPAFLLCKSNIKYGWEKCKGFVTRFYTFTKGVKSLRRMLFAKEVTALQKELFTN